MSKLTLRREPTPPEQKPVDQPKPKLEQTSSKSKLETGPKQDPARTPDDGSDDKFGKDPKDPTKKTDSPKALELQKPIPTPSGDISVKDTTEPKKSSEKDFLKALILVWLIVVVFIGVTAATGGLAAPAFLILGALASAVLGQSYFLGKLFPKNDTPSDEFAPPSKTAQFKGTPPSAELLEAGKSKKKSDVDEEEESDEPEDLKFDPTKREEPGKSETTETDTGTKPDPKEKGKDGQPKVVLKEADPNHPE